MKIIPLCLSYAGDASAAPACKASFQNDSLGDKQAVIKCSHDGSVKPIYMCSFTWERENVKGGKRTVTGKFTVVKNEKDAEKYADNRVGDEKIKRAVKPFLGHEPTGGSLNIMEYGSYRVENGVFVDMWFLIDAASAGEQLRIKAAPESSDEASKDAG